MAWTFNPALTSPLDRVRQLIGDTDAEHQELQNETILAYLGSNSVELAVAYQCALDLQAKYSRIVQVTVDHQSSYGQQVSDAYAKLAASLLSRLRQTAVGSTEDSTGIFVGGIGDCRGPYDVWTLPPLLCR